MQKECEVFPNVQFKRETALAVLKEILGAFHIHMAMTDQFRHPKICRFEAPPQNPAYIFTIKDNLSIPALVISTADSRPILTLRLIEDRAVLVVKEMERIGKVITLHAVLALKALAERIQTVIRQCIYTHYPRFLPN